MNAWLKGGLIGAGLFIILFLISIPLSGGFFGAILIMPVMSLLKIFFFVNYALNTGNVKEIFIAFFSSAIFYFIIGSIIGVIIEKIKSARNK